MANRMKEDEKNEKIIRGLLKLPANRRCINCNSLGPQYVCTNFWTFVCTNCSGIHREFTHRVKSVSMAKFTSQEVSALQGGGNERAKEIYLKEWDSQRQSAPDSSNVERLRDFIRHVYVDRRYTGERSIDKPPRAKTGDKEDSYDNRRVDTNRSGSRSPPYEDTYDRYGDKSGPAGRNDDRNYRYNYEERRSPGYGQETRYGDNRRSPGRFEVVDDRRRDDRFGNGRRSEERRFSDGESKSEGRSPNHQKDLGVSSPPMVRPVRDILGEDVPPLRIGEPPKANGGKVADGSAHTQRTASSSSLGSFDGNIGSLIDFNADPEPPNVTAAPPAQPAITPMVQSVAQPTTSASTDDGNWASFDFATQTQTQTQAQAPSNVNTLESVLSQLSGPTTAPISNMSVLPTSGGAPVISPLGNMYMPPISSAATPNVSTLPSSGRASAVAPGGMFPTLPISGGESFIRANEGGQWPNMQQHFTPSVGGVPNNQPWNSLAQGAQGPLTTSGQPSSMPTQEASGGVASQPASTEAKRSGREALPEDLFASTYSAVPVQLPRWHTGSSHGMGFGVQYPTAAPMPTYPHSSRATNPFDINNEPTMVHAASFPSMASLQGALPNTEAPSGLLRTSSVGAPAMGWMPQQSPMQSLMQTPPYASAMQSPFAAAMPQSAFMGQQVPPSNMPAVGHQGMGGFGGEAAFLGTSSMDQQLDSRYLQPSTQASFPSHGGGNPFG
ncbi:Arf GTPase activating protein [Macleaya cordata]|uniref:Arf GTPase activating protein n=1 Tax=Macleaya cordata TaxID=56857 RepID=A0A200PNF3_MACCD|nr:Arf GTPase activating protein [Macleaya cordata]